MWVKWRLLEIKQKRLAKNLIIKKLIPQSSLSLWLGYNYLQKLNASHQQLQLGAWCRC